MKLAKGVASGEDGVVLGVEEAPEVANTTVSLPLSTKSKITFHDWPQSGPSKPWNL